jgi:hypothetical protein
MKNHLQIGRSITLISFMLLNSCEKDGFNNIREDKELIQDLNSKATTTLTIDSRGYFLNAFLWRDFMPISPPNGKPLIALNWLINSDSIDIPENIVMKKQYVIYNDSVWIADYEENRSPTSPLYRLEKMSINGPKWGPGVHVDVISKILDTKTNHDYYLKCNQVMIGATY